MRLLQAGIDELPALDILDLKGRNGEEFATDEAAVWKRVLAYRMAFYLKPASILETHPGMGICSALYNHASPDSELLNSSDIFNGGSAPALIDIDPFGQPWDAIESLGDLVKNCEYLLITNGEAQAVVRNFQNALRYKTQNIGKRMPHWVTQEYIPMLESITEKKVRFFYAFPTSVRVILSKRSLPISLWKNCPNWMWWLHKYASDTNLKVT